MLHISSQLSKRLLALLLCAAMLLPCLCTPVQATEETTTEKTVYALAASDFQGDPNMGDDYDYSMAGSFSISTGNTSPIIQQIQNAGYGTFDAFFFCGDYSNGWTTNAATNGLAALKSAVSPVVDSTTDQYYIQGNHDPYDTAWNQTGWQKENEYYCVYALNEDDYPWGTGGDLEHIKSKAAELKDYLASMTVGEKPVFVLSHVPLHYSSRTETGDALYASYIFDVLNEAGQRGLNIIFMYGHNHAYGLDNYLGGATNFITRGDKIWIADPAGSNYAPTERTAHFTYMNAGFLGYYKQTDADGDGIDEVDNTLTMSVFEITGDEVVVRRFSANGEHPVKKTPGAWFDKKNELKYGYTPSTTTYASPYTISGNDLDVELPAILNNETLTVGATAFVSVPYTNGYAYTWTSDNENIAVVNAGANGTASIVAVGAGVTKITVTASGSAVTRSTTQTQSSSFYVSVEEDDGVVFAADMNQKIYRLTDHLENGKRYIIATRNNAGGTSLLTAPSGSSYTPTLTSSTVICYPNSQPFIRDPDTEYYNVWLFDDNDGDEIGHFISCCTASGYEGTNYYLVAANDELSICVDDDPTAGTGNGVTFAGLHVLSAKWKFTAGLELDVRSAKSETVGESLWLGLHENGGYVALAADSGWSASGLSSTYIYEETVVTATAYVPVKTAYVSKGATDTGVQMMIRYNTGEVKYVPITADMLSVGTGTAGTYTGVTVTYNGVAVCSDFTLVVDGANPNQYSYSGQKYYYRLTNTLTSGQEYLIVSTNAPGVGMAISANDDSKDVTPVGVLVTLDENGTPVVSAENAIADSMKFIYGISTAAAGTKYAGQQYGWFQSVEYSDSYLNTDSAETGNVNVIPWEWVDGVGSRGTSYWAISASTGTLRSWCQIHPDYREYLNFTGTKFYARFESAEGQQVYIYEKVPMTSVSYSLISTTGKVTVGSGLTSETGTKIKITYNDGSFDLVPVTADMLYLNGSKLITEDVNYLDEAIRLGNLTLKYGDTVLSNNYTLDVVAAENADYPKFPNPGSVTMDKQLGTSEFTFAQTGVAKIDLTVSGVPMPDKLDVLIIVDTSSSVGTNYVAEGITRVDAIRSAVNELVSVLKTPNPDGSLPDVQVALSQFNDYTYFDVDHSSLLNPEYDPEQEISDTNPMYLDRFGDWSSVDYNGMAMDFTSVHDLSSLDHYIIPRGGTNYDVAFHDAYQILSERKNAFGESYDRKQIVVFMSDGICFQYNYLSYRNGAADSDGWKGWLNGTLSTDELNAYVAEGARQFYNAEGKHWMAEAIKGLPGEGEYNGLYYTIQNDEHASDVTFDATKHIQYVEGLGATVYTIGFGLSVDGSVNAAAGKNILTKMASDPDMYYEAESSAELHAAFTSIGEGTRKASSSGFVMDQMGSNFDLQMGAVEQSGSETLLAAPVITLSTYALYRSSEVGTVVNGVTVTESMVGTRKSETPTAVLETITFSADGSMVYSDKIGSGINILNDDGVICGKYFYYNTNKYVSETQTNAKDIIVGGKTVTLPAETIYWYVGDITEQQSALSYYVYLEHSMGDGGVGCAAGTYDTNNYANLTYTNYRGNTCVISAPSPSLPWETASVSYAFYLVDENGNVIVNDATGETGSFANKIAVTVPVKQELRLNVDSEDIESSAAINASTVLPEGYELFDENASYSVHINSGGAGGEWNVGGTSGTTYVTNYGGAPTTQLTNNDSSANYSNTVVWFAVKYTVKAMPDTVVIDYGIPVDIHPIANDMFPEQVTIAGLIADKVMVEHIVDTEENPDTTAIFSTITKMGTEDNADKILYTATLAENGQCIRFALHKDLGMQMTSEQVFTYQVPYKYVSMKDGVKTAENRNYYSTVTVIPATTIYYEDSFLTYRSYVYTEGATDYTELTGENNLWTESAASDAMQDEDRPGNTGFSGFDADNLYGSDSAYSALATYSLNGAAKISPKMEIVDGKYKLYYGVASFTFKGTGFDVISATSNLTGTITVEIKGTTPDAEGNLYSKAYLVDTYYGYKYSNGAWIAADRADSDVLYQVPVIKASGLPYDTYTVEITASYNEFFDHGQYGDEMKYDFYLDAIRIYDPANDGASSEVIKDAYIKDKEGWPEYFELRNMIIARGDLDYTSNDSSVSVPGVVFIDNVGTNSELDVADYKNYGPNNELYLAPGQAIAFHLNVTDSNMASIQLALKSVGGTAKVSVYDATNAATASVIPTTISTATDLYYNITSLNGKTVVIRNTGAASSTSTDEETGETTVVPGDAILSITNVKITYNTAHTDNMAKTFVSMSASKALNVLNLLNNITEEDPSESESTTNAIKVTSASLSLEDEVLMNFYFTVDDAELAALDAAKDMGLLIWNEQPAEGMATIGTADTVVNGVSSNGAKFMAQTPGIAAKNLGDEVYVRVFIRKADGSYVYSKLVSYSPKQYAMSRLEKSDSQSMKALCVAMLNYGAAAQTYFDYKADSLMNADLTPAQRELVETYDESLFVGAVDNTKTGEFTTKSGFGTNNASVSFDGAFAINYYLTATNTVAGEMTFYYWTADAYARAETLTAANASGTGTMKLADGRYWTQISGIAAKQLDETFYLAAVYTDGEGNRYCTGVMDYSLSTYCMNNAVEGNDMQALAEATAMYGFYAKQYFNSNSAS